MPGGEGATVVTPGPGRRDTCGSLFPTPLLRRSTSGSTAPVGLSGPRLPAVHSLTSDGASAALCSVRSAVASAVNPPSIIPARVGARLSGWKANSGVVKSHLISGFSVQPPSPYHFGGVCPTPFPATPPACSRSTEQVLYGIRHEARTVPDIRGAQSRWRDAISSLRTRPGARQQSLSEAWGYIRDGVSAEILGRPAPGLTKNSGSVYANLPACKQRLKEYATINALKELSSPPSVCHPLLAIIKPGKKPRVCLDLSRNYNDLVKKRKFRMLALETAVRWSEKDCFYGKLDLSSCFLSFPLSPDTARDMAFELEGKFYQFSSMPFGLTSAPRIASMLLDVVSAKLHEAGVRHVRYLDDFLFIGATEASCLASMSLAAKVIKDFGLVTNPDKVEGPSQRLDFLGLVLDSTSQTTGITLERRREIEALLKDFLASRSVSRKQLLSLLGKLSFVGSVFPAARPFTRYLIDAANYREKRKGGRKSRMEKGCRDEARFWLDHLSSWNGTQRWIADQVPSVHGSDASCEGFSLICESAPSARAELRPDWFTPGSGVAGIWSPDLAPKQQHKTEIAFGELFPVVAGAVIAAPSLRDGHLVLAVDNSGVVAAINRRRTSSPRLLPLLRRLCEASVKYNFSFTAIHRPGAKNILADVLSRPSKHRFRLLLPQLLPRLLHEHRTAPPPNDKAPPTHNYAYGSFFFHDPVTRAAAASPLLTPSRVCLLSSSSLAYRIRSDWPWARE